MAVWEYSFAIFFLLTILNFCAGRIAKDPNKGGYDDLESSFLNVLNFDKYKAIFLGEKHELWVLSLDDNLDGLHIRLGTEEEVKEFDDKFGRDIEIYENAQRLVKSRSRNRPPVTEITTAKPEISADDIKQRIMKIVNKFISSAQRDSGSNGTDQSVPKLSLYFKGPYTCLNLKHNHSDWNYFITPPSLLPDWFYSDLPQLTPTGEAMCVEPPKNVENEFYKNLLDLLDVFLGFPV